MTMQAYNTNAARIGKLKGEILGHAVPVEVLGMTGMQKQMPKNSSDTVVYRRWLPYGAAVTNGNTINRWVVDPVLHVMQEGVTPPADSLVPQDIQCTLQQYAVQYSVTDKTVDLYEDDVPSEMKKQVGERMGLVREMIRYGVLKAGTNKYYGGAGTSRATVNGKTSLTMLRKIARNLALNHGKSITSVLAPSPMFATSPVEAGFVVYGSSDLEPDFRDLPGFIHTSEYGQRKTISDYELGSCERFRFVISPELTAYADAGASVAGNPGFVSTSGTNNDVYPIIVMAEDAWGQVALRGMNSIDAWWLPPSQRDKSDPGGQRGYCGAKTWFQCVILNQGWMAVGEVLTQAL
jgi:N4-gp56 family major capsid protein